MVKNTRYNELKIDYGYINNSSNFLFQSEDSNAPDLANLRSRDEQILIHMKSGARC